MFIIQKTELMWGGRKLVIETGKVARQADGAVMVTYGDTIVLCTAVAAKSPKPGVDFFPLTVNYQEKRSEEHTSELQSLMRLSYAVFSLQKKTLHLQQQKTTTSTNS